MRRLPLLLASTLVALLVLAGCGSGPDRTGAAAIVGDQVITVDEIQAGLRTAVPDLRVAVDQQGAAQGVPPGAPIPPELLAQESRRLVTVRVLHELIAEQSRRDGVVVAPQQVDAALARAGGAEAAARGSGFDAATIRELVADQIAATEIGRRVFDRLSVTVDYAATPDRASAEALAAQVAADPARAAALFGAQGAGAGATGLSLRPGTDQGGGVGQTASSVLFGLPAGTVALAPAGSGSQAGGQDPAQGPWTVIHVRERRLDAPPPGPGVVPAAAVDENTMFGFGLRQLQPLALELGVTVSPRYGAWDPTQLDVVEDEAAAGVVLPVRTTAP
ncbi:hypothetical protein [Actinomycetospora cinnamomea]|uniref:SurA-like protein n=1 Tax=Actinomycetospora cinnamomea TaxID=663609 RepID=A0A2U1EWF6_9PSEU|nr:hypothetical protein [Actinomycetospora cinnamomea]PVZ04256.1 hypothetical protein C8D89_11844 [Actinomycetospora cinnamomea]